MKTNKLLILTAMLILTTLLMSSCQGKPEYAYDTNTTETYNLSPDIDLKSVGSNQLPVDKEYAKDITDLTNRADLIVIVRVISNGKAYVETIPTMNAEQGKKQGGTIHVALTTTRLKVEEVLYGDEKSGEIELVQVDYPGKDAGDTKVKNGDTMLVILKKNPDRNDYTSVAYEEALFIVQEDNTVVSLSDNVKIAKYDNTEMGLLARDIKKAVQQS